MISVNRPLISCLIASAVLSLALLPAALHSAEPKAPPKKTERPNLEDALLKDLDNELLEGAGDLKSKPRPASDQPDDKKGEDTAVGEDIGMPSEDADPLVRISHEMRRLENLVSGQTKGEAAPIQKQVIEELAKLIEQAEKRAAQQQSSSSKKQKPQQQVANRQGVKPSKPSSGKPGNSGQSAQDSTDKLRNSEAAQVDPAALRGLLKDAWGNLPQREREQMLQNSPERFLPQYELMIERYYKRLAEEQSRK